MSDQTPAAGVDSSLSKDVRLLERAASTRGEDVYQLPDLVAGLSLFAYGKHTNTGSYTTGGDPYNPARPTVPNYKRVLFESPAGAHFNDNAGLVQVFTTYVTELAALTNLAAAVADVGYIVVGSRDPDVDLFIEHGASHLVRVDLVLAADVPKSATQWWRIRAQIVRAEGGDVFELGILDTSGGITGGERYTLFEAFGRDDQEDLRPGDRLRLFLSETGQGPALVSPLVFVQRRRS